MTYTLKLDWNDKQLELLRKALAWYASRNPQDYRAAKAMLDEINLYRGTVEEVKESLTTETTGYCRGCGEYIELVAGKGWKAVYGFHCQAHDHHRHVKYDQGCTASSWGGKSHQPYGIDDLNRCTLPAVPEHDNHVDSFGNIFTHHPFAKGGNADPKVKVTGHQKGSDNA